jgi:hypothetical protein
MRLKNGKKALTFIINKTNVVLIPRKDYLLFLVWIKLMNLLKNKSKRQLHIQDGICFNAKTARGSIRWLLLRQLRCRVPFHAIVPVHLPALVTFLGNTYSGGENITAGSSFTGNRNLVQNPLPGFCPGKLSQRYIHRGRNRTFCGFRLLRDGKRIKKDKKVIPGVILTAYLTIPRTVIH